MKNSPRVSGGEPGLLLLGPADGVAYANDAAMYILAYPEDPRQISASDNSISKRIRDFVTVEGKARLPGAKSLLSGRRNYVCHFLSLESDSSNHNATLAVLMERPRQASFLVSSAAQKYRLTRREEGTLEFLLKGLTSKEIALRMRISPNTVKSFLRLVMAKMGVSTRSGIVGKVLEL
jgi:DNA-binding CsgD family transcriptional regulator